MGALPRIFVVARIVFFWREAQQNFAENKDLQAFEALASWNKITPW